MTEHLSQIHKDVCTNKNMYVKVHSTFIHNRQRTGSIQRPSIGEWLHGGLW